MLPLDQPHDSYLSPPTPSDCCYGAKNDYKTAGASECNTALLDLILSGLIAGFKLLKTDTKIQGKQLLHEVYGEEREIY